MTTHVVRVDGRYFGQLDSGELADVKGRMVDTVHSGGGFVSIPSAEHGVVDVLVTSHTTVSIEEVSFGEGLLSTTYIGEFVAAEDLLAHTVLEYETYGLDPLPV